MSNIVKINQDILEITNKNSAFEMPHGIRHTIGFDTEYEGEVTLSLQFYSLEREESIIYVDENQQVLPEKTGRKYAKVKILSDQATISSIFADLITQLDIKPGENIAIFAHYAANDYVRFRDFFSTKTLDDAVKIYKKKISGKYTLEQNFFYLFDTCYFFPTSLKDAAKGTSRTKQELPNKDKPHTVLLQNPGIFFDYAETDAVIVAELGREILRGMYIMEKITGVKSFSTTPSAILANVFASESIPQPAELLDYKGGHTESFYYGKVTAERVYDYDIISAYNSILASIPAWETFPTHFSETNELYDFMLNNNLAAGEVELDFKFKYGVPTTFPVITRNGQAFPVIGRTTVSPQEFFTATPYLESCRIVSAQIYKPTNELSYRAKVMRQVITLRALVKPTNPVLEKVFKIIANSGYGVHAQGLGGKTYTSLEPDLNDYNKFDKVVEKIPLSKASNVLVASFITAIARAVLAEYIYKFNDDKTKLYLVATDGFIIDRKLSREEMAGVGVYGKLLNKVRADLITDNTQNPLDTPILEGNSSHSLYIFDARRYVIGDKLKFSGGKGISITSLRRRTALATEANEQLFTSVERMQSPVDAYDKKREVQKKHLFSSNITRFSILPDLGRKKWVQINEKIGPGEYVRFRAKAEPLDSDLEVARLDNYKRTKCGEKLNAIPLTKDSNRIAARNRIFHLGLSKADVVRVIFKLYPNVSKTDLIKCFKVGKNTFYQKLDKGAVIPVLAGEFIKDLTLTLDCYIDFQYNGHTHKSKCEELLKILDKNKSTSREH
jgi:hypothetical protein